MMKKYDAVVIGAGPAGGQCARELTQEGFKVLIVDKAKSFLENNYSSGGAPLNVMLDFNLPDSIVGTYWNILRVNSTQTKATWTSTSPFGPVIDFDKLRAFLVEETIKRGGEFRFHCQYQSHQIYSHAIEVYLKDLSTSTIFPVQASVLVDATGTERRVLAQQEYDKQQAIAATGIEYHVEVDTHTYNTFSKALNFFLGHHWMPQGYAWIFPMSPSTLKVGVIRYFQNKNYVPYDPSYKHYLEQLLGICGSYQIKDKHGKTIYYTEGQKDIRYQRHIIAIGDAVSAVNPLGWEGIRHAMHSGRFAARTIKNYLMGKVRDFSAYDRALQQYFGRKWYLSEKFMGLLFKTKNDSKIDRSLAFYSSLNNEEIMQMLFGYRFRCSFAPYFRFFLSHLRKIYFCSK
jgi:digeranylgeranylglycerophospholipid reductase